MRAFWLMKRITYILFLLSIFFGQTYAQQKPAAYSSSVVLASDQPAITVTSDPLLATIASNTNGSDTTAAGTITTQNLVPAGAPTAGSAVAISTNGRPTVGLQVTGTYTGALTPQATIDGSVWVTLNGLINQNTGAFSTTVASAAQSIYQIESSGYAQVRLTALSAVTGTATISVRGSSSTALIALDAPIPAGTNVIGALSPNQSINVAQINGVSPLMGNGVTGTGSPRVTISSDNTPTALLAPGTASTNALTTVPGAALGLKNVKSTAGNLYGFTVVNPNASVIYIQFYNNAGAPTRGTSVIFSVPVAPSQTVYFPPSTFPLANFSTGIAAAAATTYSGSTAVGAEPDVTFFIK